MFLLSLFSRISLSSLSLSLFLLSFILLILTRKITRTGNGNIDRFQKNLHSVPCRKRSIMFLPSLFSRISSSSSSLSLLTLFYLAHFDKKNHTYRKRKYRQILEKSAQCAMQEKINYVFAEFIQPHIVVVILSVSLCSLLSGSFCVANCQRGWCEARHLPSKLTRQQRPSKIF